MPGPRKDAPPADDADEVPEEATLEPTIETPGEDAERADERLERQERDHAARWPHTKDPLRQPGEMTPAPEKRGKKEEDEDTTEK